MKSTTEQDYRRRIARVVEAILAEPSGQHTLESLAAIAHFSPFHFHRVYKSLTGETVAETIQRLRLAEAANRLTDSTHSVTSVASDVGYDSAQAFARAFRRFAGVSPGTFRSRQEDVSAFPIPLADKLDGGQIVADDTRTVATIELPASTLLCLRHDGPTATIGQTYRLLLRLLGIDAASKKHQVIGLCIGNPEHRDGFRYFAGIIPSSGMKPVGAIQPVCLEGGLYASTRLVGPYALIGPTFRTLFNGWLPRSGYLSDGRPALELYRNPPLSGLKHQSVTDLAIPVREA
ncbi:MAG TPA: GyrI-like domain-containing protein [Trinickia sp.]|jgi:AraC family transcriptional regulator|uniref:AraC family transcriptional regulator n=1 Tax=Trinickia sp. TaxID=2571163 RepID=UPI002F3EE910